MHARSRPRSVRHLLASGLGALALSACAASSAPRREAEPAPLEVVVIGTTHSNHVDSDEYGLPELEALLRAVAPDAVLCEIPPDRFPIADAEFSSTGAITEPRVARFPEYTELLFPLRAELGYEIVPCAGWTAEMAEQRSAQLAAWRTTRPEDTSIVDAGRASIDRFLTEIGLGDRPEDIHTSIYDAAVRAGMQPYQELFGDDLGPGGWDNINASHWALLSAALDRIVTEGEARRVAITFGAGHKYWFHDRLAERDDVVVRSAAAFL